MDKYYVLQDQAHAKWMEAQEVITRAETLYDHGKIDETEWYRMLADARSLQEAAIDLEKQAADAQVMYWREKFIQTQMAEQEARIKEWHEQMIDERPY